MPMLATVSAIAPNHSDPIAGQKALRIAEMRFYLARSQPQSATEALRLLRIAYPDAPLMLRVAACA